MQKKKKKPYSSIQPLVYGVKNVPAHISSHSLRPALCPLLSLSPISCCVWNLSNAPSLWFFTLLSWQCARKQIQFIP